jgi:hypothetical protein
VGCHHLDGMNIAEVVGFHILVDRGFADSAAVAVAD